MRKNCSCQQRGRKGTGVVFTTTSIAWSEFNPHSGHVVASLDKTFYADYLCLVASNKQQIYVGRSQTLIGKHENGQPLSGWGFVQIECVTFTAEDKHGSINQNCRSSKSPVWMQFEGYFVPYLQYRFPSKIFKVRGEAKVGNFREWSLRCLLKIRRSCRWRQIL